MITELTATPLGPAGPTGPVSPFGPTGPGGPAGPSLHRIVPARATEMESAKRIITNAATGRLLIC